MSSVNDAWLSDVRKFQAYWQRRVLAGKCSPLDRGEVLVIAIYAKWLHRFVARQRREVIRMAKKCKPKGGKGK